MTDRDQVEESQNSQPQKSSKLPTYLMLHGILFLFSIAAVCLKKASLSDFLSPEFFAWYGGVLVILFIYAIVWQQVLKRLPLFTAYINKGITIIWGLLWGMLIFGESISVTMILGAVLVFAGTIQVVASNAK